MAKKSLSGIRGEIDRVLKDEAFLAADRLNALAYAAIGSRYERHFHRQGSERAYSIGVGVYDNESFYGEYDPLWYERTGNLEHSYRSTVDTTKSFRSSKNRIGHTATIEFSEKYMKHDRHHPKNGGGAYPKELVLDWCYGKGWHGTFGNFDADGVGATLDFVKGVKVKKKSYTRHATGDKYKVGFLKMNNAPSTKMKNGTFHMMKDKKRIGRVTSAILRATLERIADEFDSY